MWGCLAAQSCSSSACAWLELQGCASCVTSEDSCSPQQPFKACRVCDRSAVSLCLLIADLTVLACARKPALPQRKQVYPSDGILRPRIRPWVQSRGVEISNSPPVGSLHTQFVGTPPWKIEYFYTWFQFHTNLPPNFTTMAQAVYIDSTLRKVREGLSLVTEEQSLLFWFCFERLHGCTIDPGEEHACHHNNTTRC